MKQRKTYKTYTPEFKQEAVRLMESEFKGTPTVQTGEKNIKGTPTV